MIEIRRKSGLAATRSALEAVAAISSLATRKSRCHVPILRFGVAAITLGLSFLASWLLGFAVNVTPKHQDVLPERVTWLVRYYRIYTQLFVAAFASSRSMPLTQALANE